MPSCHYHALQTHSYTFAYNAMLYKNAFNQPKQHPLEEDTEEHQGHDSLRPLCKLFNLVQ
jgi:hypothetical protein